VGGVLAPNGKIYFVNYDITQILELKRKVPNLIGTDAQIPTDLSTLATSAYNRYYNKY
jgi:hypothetical protein